MPGWETTENEYRLRIREPDIFTPGSFFIKDLQGKPRNYAVFGRLKGENNSTIQSLRFPKLDWEESAAQKWYEDHKESIEKFQATTDVEGNSEVPKAEIEIQFLEKSNLLVQSLNFDESEFSEKAVKDWLASKNMDISAIKKDANAWSIELRPESQFIQGSLRDILLRKGIKATVGLLKRSEINKKVPDRFEIKASALNNLFDLDIVEVTLTRAPIVGKMAEFSVIKSADIEENYQSCVPILKVNKELQRVGAYVLVPNLPDWVGDMITPEEIELAAHKFMRNLAFRQAKGTGSGLEHLKFNGVGYPIESYVDKSGVNGVPGGWWLETQVTEPETWKKISQGEIVGYSIGGSGRRRKINLDMETPITKSEDIAETIVSKLAKLLGLSKTNTVVKSENTKIDEAMEVKKTMNLEALKKYDLKPSEVESLEKSGVNMEEAIQAMEKLAKAINFNFSMDGIGYTTKKIVEILRRGEFGAFPNEGSAWNSTNGSNVAKAQQQNPSQNALPAPVSNQGIESMAKAIEDIAKGMTGMNEVMKNIMDAMDGVTSRLNVLENMRGIRKSTTSVPPENVPPTPDTTFDSVDKMDLSIKKCQEVLKSCGVRL